MNDFSTEGLSPTSHQPMRPGRTLGSPVDYSAHPAYAELVGNASKTSRVLAPGRFLAKFMLLLAKRAIRYEMIPRPYRQSREINGMARFSLAAIHNLFSSRGPRVTEGHAAGSVAQRLAECGVAVIKLSTVQRDALLAQLEPHFATLRERRGAVQGNRQREFEESRSYADPRTHPELYRTLRSIFADSGILAAAEAYIGRPVDLVDANPQINDKTDSFWAEIFPDKEDLAFPNAAYFHRDASGGDLKAIVYCSDVGPDNGPFTYAIGSNRVEVSTLDDLIMEANDHNGLSSTEPRARAAFAALPKRFRQKGSFGNDLLNDSELAKEIVDASWSITGEAGSVVLFDTKGIHRGGLVTDGERMVVTCVIG